MPHTQATAALLVVLAILVVLLVDAGLVFVGFVRRDAEQSGLERPLFAPTWSLVDVWFGGQLVVAGTLGVMLLILGFVARAAAHSTAHVGAVAASQDAMLRLIVPLLVVQSAMLVLVPVLYITRKYRTPLSAIGLGWPPGRRALLALLLGPLMLAAGLGLALGVEYALRIVLGPAVYQALEDATRRLGNEVLIKQALSAPGLGIPVVIVGGIVAPFAEEMFFRGFLFNSAKRRLGFWGGAVLSAFLFALAHAGPLLVLAIVPIGIALAWAYERTGSLWVPILMHAIFNTAQLVWALVAGGHI